MKHLKSLKGIRSSWYRCLKDTPTFSKLPPFLRYLVCVIRLLVMPNLSLPHNISCAGECWTIRFKSLDLSIYFFYLALSVGSVSHRLDPRLIWFLFQSNFGACLRNRNRNSEITTRTRLGDDRANCITSTTSTFITTSTTIVNFWHALFVDLDLGEHHFWPFALCLDW